MFSTIHVKEVSNPSDLYLKVQSERHGYMALVVKILFIILFGYLVQVMCDNKLQKVAWIVMFLPFVLFLFVILYTMSIGAIMAVRGNTGLLVGSAN
jgi:tetrahydromethanopterin S-methyltransferase subunit E